MVALAFTELLVGADPEPHFGGLIPELDFAGHDRLSCESFLTLLFAI